MDPEIIKRSGYYRFHWRDLANGISLEASRLYETKSTLRAEVTISSNGQHVLRDSANLLSANWKHGLAKKLLNYQHLSDKGWPEPWEKLIEDSCEEIIDHFRQGNPVEVVGTNPISSGLNWQLYPFLPYRQIAMLYGKAGSFKSTLATAMALSIQTGVPILGWEPEQANVLILDWESTAQDANDHIKALQAGLEVWPSETVSILYKRCSRGLAEMGEDLRRECAQHDVGVLIVDSAVMAVGGDPNSTEEVLPMLTLLRDLDVSALLISHPPKNAKTPSPYGSGYFYNEARCVWLIRASRSEDKLDMILEQDKINNAPFHPPVAYRATFELTGTIAMKRQDSRALAYLSGSNSDRILFALRRGELSPSQIASITGLSASQVSKELTGLKAKNLVTNPSRGNWALLAPEWENEPYG